MSIFEEYGAFKWEYFNPTDHILSETICLFCSKKLKLQLKIGLIYAISIVKRFFNLFFFLREYFNLLSTDI